METRGSFSIIIPTYRRPRQLATCLDAVSRIQYPKNSFEVLVVNDGVENLPSDVVQPFNNRVNLRLLTQQHNGPAAARNTGAKNAKGQWLAFIDDDCEPDP